MFLGKFADEGDNRLLPHVQPLTNRKCVENPVFFYNPVQYFIYQKLFFCHSSYKHLKVVSV
jgi:hypothetical protein